MSRFLLRPASISMLYESACAMSLYMCIVLRTLVSYINGYILFIAFIWSSVVWLLSYLLLLLFFLLLLLLLYFRTCFSCWRAHPKFAWQWNKSLRCRFNGHLSLGTCTQLHTHGPSSANALRLSKWKRN